MSRKRNKRNTIIRQKSVRKNPSLTKAQIKPPKSRREVGRKTDLFTDCWSDDPILKETEVQIHFIKSSYNISFMEHFWQKFSDSDLWRLIIGTFFSALFVGYDWHLIAILSFLVLMTTYSQMKSREKTNAIEYCSRVLSEDPDRLKQFLATISAPKNLSNSTSGEASCEWVNDIMAKFWPHINSIAQQQIDKKGFSKKGLDVGNGHKIYFERFTLGDKPPALTSVHVRRTGHRKDEITIILKLIYFGNCLILFSYKTKLFLKAKAGVKDVYFRGTAVVVLRPLMEAPPFVGGLSVCLSDVPLIDYNGLNLANIADNKMFKKFLSNILRDYLVTPNKIYISLLNNANIKRELKYPVPIGLCFVDIIEAEGLPAMDSNRCLIFEGTSDSFCKVKVGDIQFTTKTVYSTLNPFYNQDFSAPIHDFNDILRIEVFDSDSISSDDFMGSLQFQISDIGRNPYLNGRDKWLPIGRSITGSLHFRIAVFELSSNAKNIPKIELSLKQSSVKFPVGMLSVYIYYVSHISTEDEEFDFKPMVRLKFSEQTFETNVSKSLQKGFYYFEESSHFLVNHIENEILEVCVFSHETSSTSFSKVFGQCNIAVKDIIGSKTDMTLNQVFPLKKILQLKDVTEVNNSGLIRMFLSLRVCKFRRKLMENLKIASNIQANIEQTTENHNSITKIYREPMDSLKNPIRSVKIIGNNISPFAPLDKTIVAEDKTKIPKHLVSEGCWLKIRIKWPDRTSLHLEVLKLIHIPVPIIDQSFKYAVCVKLSLRQRVAHSLSQTVRKRIGFNAFEETEKIKGLQKRTTNKYPIINYVNEISFNERLIFKISSVNDIDSHVFEFFLVVYQPRKYFSVVYDSTIVGSSKMIDIPKVDFKGDPIEEWYQIELIERYQYFFNKYIL